MKARLASLLLALSALSARAESEPTREEVWELIRAASALYESLDAVDYDVPIRVPEVESLIQAKTGGLLGPPEIHIQRSGLVNTLLFSFPDLPDILRSKAEERAKKEAESIDAVTAFREVGWTLFGAFIKSIDPSASADVLQWDDDIAVVEFDEIGERFMSKNLRSCRFTIDRRRSTILEMRGWFGGANEIGFALDYDDREFFPGTRLPLAKAIHVRQTGFRGPPKMSFIAGVGKYTRSAEALADDASTSWRAQLKRAGLTRFQIDHAKADADGGLSLDFSESNLTVLPPLAGLPVKSLNLSRTKIADLRPLAGLPLRSLILDDTPVTDLAPLAGLPLEDLSLRNVRARDFSILKNFALKKLSVAGSNASFDLSLLAGMPLEDLDLQHLPVADLTPLRGMPLRDLNLESTKVADLEPLRRMPLTRLSLRWTAIRDVAPLAECSELALLAISGTQVEDLRPLSGLPLVHLDLGRSHVRDLAPLRGMPLRFLSADNLDVLDIAPLMECLELERATVPTRATNIPLLQKHAALKELSFRWDNSREGPAQTVAEFWTEWNSAAGVQQRAVLASLRQKIEETGRAGGFKINVADLEDGTFSVDLKGQPISDLTSLSGLPISILLLDDTKIRDLAPLRGMPLRRLSLTRTDITDLSPLRGMALTDLNVNGCPVSDLSSIAGMKLGWLGLGVRDLNTPAPIGTKVADLEPLRGMPFKRAILDGTINPDLAPLLDCPNIEEVVLPPEYRNIDALRKHPSLQSFTFGTSQRGRQTLPVADFWKQRDARK